MVSLHFSFKRRVAVSQIFDMTLELINECAILFGLALRIIDKSKLKKNAVCAHKTVRQNLTVFCMCMCM